MTDYEKAYSQWKVVSQMHRANTDMFRQRRLSMSQFLESKKSFDNASAVLDKVPFAEHNDKNPANV